MKYFWKQFIAAHIVYAHKQRKTINITSPYLKWDKEGFPFHTNIEILNQKEIRISHELGSDILIEAAALLNYLNKPENELNRYGCGSFAARQN
ncbi:MAG: hypothetical protein HKP58_09815 [Desulfatitalea sp.]|nr:hypothetical protein [Desulfatitalea sp.]NNK00698.1 hypothetical protein [Desulfatitalea sp.]